MITTPMSLRSNSRGLYSAERLQRLCKM
jgi:hypothetical protein